ncbi:hypothetical protein H257_18505 [Aphanomyces astaci]|uniref:Uncharacterized protein n=1 Tax=Aphanomyces astaci TaxID=112090 RepID=W4FAV4_APHAT|nr:hypothetical protein H257_18505 [Aphanomyces astaci]ETV64620.1 hypothetical protein H257_18505 [Aphanomyces astaci]|eukprot:XP_009845882.1 hypothetical protein H257_18505 [Aphanomyces astaci]
MGGQGPKSLFPFKDDLLEYLRGRRAKKKYLRYIEAKKSYESFGHLLRHVCKRHRFSHRIPCANKVHRFVLDNV